MKHRVGILAIQGAVKEHIDMVSSIPGAEAVPVKKAEEIANIDGLILPGGESTAIGKLLKDYHLIEPIKKRAEEGMPVWGTCAGMILMAKSISNQADTHLGIMDIKVCRNGYGGQLDSFKTRTVIPTVSANSIPLVFIRAPFVEEVGKDVRILCSLDNRIVAVEQGNLLATSFHPELTNDLSFHRYFVEKIKL